MLTTSHPLTATFPSLASIEDVKRLKAMNLYGAIIGKALYDKKIDFKEAQQLCLLGE
ncbi:hypothetical protein [Clostridioides difficile]|uniref:hypothetical protein n=1 Tax=Clostridioides difficile TaxID=1496 RepID=UPI0020B1CEE4|nr:hypothetical protein [Clostridioides difficile]